MHGGSEVRVDQLWHQAMAWGGQVEPVKSDSRLVVEWCFHGRGGAESARGAGLSPEFPS